MSETSRFGGELAEMPQPLRRLFPGNTRRKRIVRVSFEMFYGIGRHTYARVEEEANPVWDGEQWCEPWRDDAGEGQRFTKSFVDADAAGRWAQRIIDKHFPGHRPIKARDEIYQRRPRRWFYRDGD